MKSASFGIFLIRAIRGQILFARVPEDCCNVG